MAASQSQPDDEGLGGDFDLNLDDTGISALETDDGEEVLNASVPALAAAWVKEKVSDFEHGEADSPYTYLIPCTECP